MRVSHLSRRLGRYIRWSFILLICFKAQWLHAHPAYLTSASAKVERNGQFSLTLSFDALAFALNDTSERVPDPPMNALMDGPRAELEQQMLSAQNRFDRHFQIIANGHSLSPAEIHFPSADDVLAWKASGRSPRLPVLLQVAVRGQLPAGTSTIAFSFPEIIGNVVLTVERPGEEPYTEPVAPGTPSSDLTIALPPSPTSAASNLAQQNSEPKAPSSFFITVARFIKLGLLHILPRGLDHVLFMLGLFLLAKRLSVLLWQVTAFTLAHSVTLGLSLYGVVTWPTSVVEPLIALSIVLVAIDNLRGQELRWWRVAVVFTFGLVHGLGFAGILSSLDLPRSEFLRALIGFSIGVEFGQIAVICLAFIAVGWFRQSARYRQIVVIPASLTIGLIALFWTAQRLLHSFSSMKW
ncbi:MAG: HupE/UreJ family protein [Nibricoccus sp.]